ncbi:MAG TPA: AraC family transcriptional regulator [Gemmataceae bacterium]|jgi:AraC family L-rhamnose operon regulatory protein RhaS|nr:AraC family transcriptional regulator [Gemmataceae bacterium]
MSQPFRHRPVDVALLPHGVFVLESRHAPGFRMASQRHDFLELFYVLDGRGTFELAGKPRPCEKDDVVVVPVGCRHRIADDPARPLQLYGICVAPHVWRAEPELTAQLGAGPLSVPPLARAQVRADLRRLLYEQTLGRPGGRAWSVGQALQLLVLLARARPGAAPRPEGPAAGLRQSVQRYLAELPHRFFEATDLDRVAAELGMSRRRFTQLFREAAGASWSDHLARLRVEYACQLLRETTRSVSAVAFECGFEDLSSFYRAFKRRTGLPPHAWRQAQAAD